MKTRKKKNRLIVLLCLIAFFVLLIYFVLKGLWVCFAIGVWIFLIYIGLGMCAIAKQADKQMEDILNHEKHKKNKRR